MGIRSKRTESDMISGEQWLVVSYLPASPGLWEVVVGPCLSIHSDCQVISVGRHVKVRDGTVQHKKLKRAGEMTDPCGIPTRSYWKVDGCLW